MKNGSKSDARASSGMPSPASSIVIATPESSRVTATASSPPAGIDSLALRTRFRIACRIWPSSRRTSARSSSTRTLAWTLARASSGSTKRISSRTSCPTSPSSRTGFGRRARPRYCSESPRRRSTSPRIAFVSSRASLSIGRPASSSSRSSTLRPIAEIGFRISCVTWAAIRPTAARRSAWTSSPRARAIAPTMLSNVVASSPISSGEATTARGVRSPRATASARSVTRVSGARTRRA